MLLLVDNPNYSESISRNVNGRRQLTSAEGIKLLSEMTSIRNNTNFAEETGISSNGKESPFFCAHDEINKMIQNVEALNLSTEQNNLILKCFLPKMYIARPDLCISCLCIELTPFSCSGKFNECGLLSLK